MDTDEDDVPMKNAGGRSPKGRRLSPKSRDRAGVKTLDLRRPVRPVDREKMRPWLKNHLDSGTVFGLKWLSKEEGTFQVSWRHASRLGWNLETDGDVFEKWARHTGIYKDGDEPEPKRWKANFRCAIHSLPDVKELTDPVERRGHNANRTYRFLLPDEIGAQVKRKSVPVQQPVRPPAKQQYEEDPPTVEDSDDSSSQSQQADSDKNDEDEGQYREIYVLPQSDHDYAVRIERKDGEESSVTKVLSEHGSAFVLIKTKKQTNLPTTLAEALDISQSLEHSRAAQRSAHVPSRVNLKAGKKGTAASKGKGRLSVNTRTLLGGKKPTEASRTFNAVAAGAGKVNTFSLLSGNRVDPVESSSGSPQTLGFDALLAAANMARMDTMTDSSAATTAFTASTTSQAAPAVTTCPPALAMAHSAGHTTYTLHQDPPAAVTFSSAAAQAVHSEAESRIIEIHPNMSEASVPSQSPITAQSSFVINMLQNLLGTSPVSAVLPSEVSVASTSGQGVQVRDSSPLTTLTPTIQQASYGMGAVSVRTSSGPVPVSLESFQPGSANAVPEGSRLKALLHQVGSQAVTTVPCAATYVATAPTSSTVTGMSATSVSSSDQQHAQRTTMPSVLEIKTEPLDLMKVENATWTEIGHFNTDDISVKEEKNLSPTSGPESSSVRSTASLPTARVVHTQPTDHSAFIVQQSNSLQAVPSDVKDSLEPSVTSQVTAVSVTPQTTVSLSSPALSASGSQVSGTSLQVSGGSLPQTFNMGPVFVMNPSIVLTLPQNSTNAASQQEGGSVVTLPISDLQDLFNMCFAGGAQQVLQRVEPGNVTAAGNVTTAHIPDSTVSDVHPMDTAGESGQGQVVLGDVSAAALSSSSVGQGQVVLGNVSAAALTSTGVASSAVRPMTITVAAGEHGLTSASVTSQSAFCVSDSSSSANL